MLRGAQEYPAFVSEAEAALGGGGGEGSLGRVPLWTRDKVLMPCFFLFCENLLFILEL